VLVDFSGSKLAPKDFCNDSFVVLEIRYNPKDAVKIVSEGTECSITSSAEHASYCTCSMIVIDSKLIVFAFGLFGMTDGTATTLSYEDGFTVFWSDFVFFL
jgi:hypothetical protein